MLFYAFAAVTVAGGLATSLLDGRARALGLAAVTIGLVGLLADLDAGLAAIFSLVAFGACTMLVLRLSSPAEATEPAGAARQAGAALAGAVLLALAYIAFKGSYFHGGGGAIGVLNSAALGRLLFGRDALAVEALVVALLAALAGGWLPLRGRAR